MSNMRAIVERTLHLQLQHFARFRSSIPVFAAFVIFSALPIVRGASSTSVFALVTTFRKALVKPRYIIPVLSSLFDLFAHTLNTACLRMRIHLKVPIQWRQMFHRRCGQSTDHDTYATPRAAARYWRVAGRYGLRLYSGNGATCAPSTISAASPDGTIISLVTYYTPRLLPLYRGRSSGKRTWGQVDAQATWISPKTFCKWHRMVFQDSCHPTLAQAVVQMKYYSNRDLREIQRIARLLPDEQVFGRKGKDAWETKRMMKYSRMWKSWLEGKETDLVIVFE